MIDCLGVVCCVTFSPLRPLPLHELQDPVVDNSWHHWWRSHWSSIFLYSKYSADKWTKWKDEINLNGEWVSTWRGKFVYRPCVETCRQCEPSQPPVRAQIPDGFHAPAPALVLDHNSATGQPGSYCTSSGRTGHCRHPPAACQQLNIN